MNATVSLYRWDELALEKVTEMISRKIVTGEREMLAQIYLKKGALVPMHSHESEQITYVLQGALKFLINGEEITVREGEVLLIPSWVDAPGRSARRHVRAGSLQPDPHGLAEDSAPTTSLPQVRARRTRTAPADRRTRPSRLSVHIPVPVGAAA